MNQWDVIKQHLLVKLAVKINSLKIIIFLLLFLLVGCASDNGSKIVGGNLSVYYSSENLKEKANNTFDSLLWDPRSPFA